MLQPSLPDSGGAALMLRREPPLLYMSMDAVGRETRKSENGGVGAAFSVCNDASEQAAVREGGHSTSKHSSWSVTTATIERSRHLTLEKQNERLAALKASVEWAAYSAMPAAKQLNGLLAITERSRALLVQAIAELFYEHENWRVAQHAALLHLDPLSATPDLVKALCFADKACRLSLQDSRARLTMARLNWARRLPLAVLSDVTLVYAGETRLCAEIGRGADRFLGEAFVLEGMARAYLHDLTTAQARLTDAERLGFLTVEGVVQLLVAAELHDPAIASWAAQRIPPNVELGGRAGGLHLRTQRRRFLELLARR